MKCPAHNCRAEYIGETNRSLKERVSDHRNETTSVIRNHRTSTKHPEAELKDFTKIDRNNNALHHQAKEALHIRIKDPSVNRNIGKVSLPSILSTILHMKSPKFSVGGPPYPRFIKKMPEISRIPDTRHWSSFATKLHEVAHEPNR